MKTSEVSKILETLCPLSLAPFEFNGLLTSAENNDVKKLGFTLGFSETSIKKAIEENIDMLIVHNAPETLLQGDNYFKNIRKLSEKSFLSIYKMHLPLDFAKNGIIDQLCRIMLFKAKPVKLFYNKQVIMGGVYVAKENVIFEEIMKRILLLNPSTIRIIKRGKRNITKVAITSGDGCKPEFLLQLKPDVFICGLLNQESIRIANDLGIILIEATSYATENEPFKKFVELNKSLFKNIKVNFIDVKNDVTEYNGDSV